MRDSLFWAGRTSIAMRWPPLPKPPEFVAPSLSLRGGLLVSVVVVDFSAAFLFMRASCGSGGDAGLSSTAGLITALPFEQMEVSNP